MVCLSIFGGLRSATMRVEVLYFDGCPTYLKAEKTLHGILEEKGVDAEVELVAINTAEEARELRFPGSPTIRVDGEDLFPVPERAEYALGCRILRKPGRLEGIAHDRDALGSAGEDGGYSCQRRPLLISVQTPKPRIPAA
jgi:hypothetical protein